EFFFAVSVRELLPFLRANGVAAQVNASECRSLKDLESEDRARSEQARNAAAAKELASATVSARRREALEQESTFAVLADRDNALALALIAWVLATAAAGYAYLRHQAEDWRGRRLGLGLAGIAVLAGAIAWFTRPGFADIEERVADRLAAETDATPAQVTAASPEGELICVLDQDRSRVTGAAAEDLPFQWRADGCVNGRTQYGLSSGNWARVLVPETEAAVSVNSFDPASGEYRMERYLLDHQAMANARAARAAYQAPACGGNASVAADLGAQQQGIISLLPESPNERLVYRCSPAS
ncbi:MAG: serine protease, partial [Croceibacterium sp.]